MFAITRAVNGIGINGDEWLLNGDGTVMLFQTEDDAETFVCINGLVDQVDIVPYKVPNTWRGSTVSEQFKYAKEYEGNDAPEYMHCSKCDTKIDGDTLFYVGDLCLCTKCNKTENNITL